ncbi:hypothetical protein TNCV_2952371 [Trichonephila clavipes]|nr:hypothetical protein TNCV_2952371 [Trichonephila clavipes]
MNIPNGDLVAVKINGSKVQTNGQGIKESKREVAFTCVFKNRILYSNRRGRLRKECISNFIDSTMEQCCHDLITGIVKLELKVGLEVVKLHRPSMTDELFKGGGVGVERSINTCYRGWVVSRLGMWNVKFHNSVFGYDGVKSCPSVC